VTTHDAAVPDRVVVAITGATGAILGIRLLQRLAEFGVERHLIVSAWGARTIAHETEYDIDQVRELADVTHKVTDLGATLSSGSFITRGMIIAPCSVKTLSAIATGLSADLIARAADVTLKERRRLILMVRESPLSEVHLENMARLVRMGADIVPPMVSFYTRPASIDEMTDHIVTRALDQLGLHSAATPRWDGELG
jgi:4-hydroxy-3-polyprenylbenzoate decarboxylase